MNTAQFITWHTKDGLKIQETFPAGLEQRKYIERPVVRPLALHVGDLNDRVKNSSFSTQVYKFDRVELLYFQSTDANDPLAKKTPIYTSHYIAQ